MMVYEDGIIPREVKDNVVTSSFEEFDYLTFALPHHMYAKQIPQYSTSS